MSRFSFIARHPRRSLGALATLMVAAGLTVGSGAYFTTQQSSGANTINAGHVGLTEFASDSPLINAADPNAVVQDDTVDPSKVSDITFNISNAYPGVHFDRAFAFENTGTVPEYLKLSVVHTPGTSNDLLKATDIGITRMPLQGLTGTAEPTFPYNGGTQTNNYSLVQGGTPEQAADGSDAITNVIADTETNYAGPSQGQRIALLPGESYQYELDINIPDTGANQNGLQDQTEGFTVVGTANTSPTA